MPRFLLITEDYGKTWMRISFRNFYNLICSPEKSKPSFWFCNKKTRTITSWDYLQMDQRYNDYDKFCNQKIDFFSFKLRFQKLLVTLRLIKNLFNEKRIYETFRAQTI